MRDCGPSARKERNGARSRLTVTLFVTYGLAQFFDDLFGSRPRVELDKCRVQHVVQWRSPGGERSERFGRSLSRFLGPLGTELVHEEGDEGVGDWQWVQAQDAAERNVGRELFEVDPMLAHADGSLTQRSNAHRSSFALS